MSFAALRAALSSEIQRAAYVLLNGAGGGNQVGSTAPQVPSRRQPWRSAPADGREPLGHAAVDRK